jgi:hypothetical protein
VEFQGKKTVFFNCLFRYLNQHLPAVPDSVPIAVTKQHQPALPFKVAGTQYCRAEFFGHTGLDGNERKGKVKMPCLFYL